MRLAAALLLFLATSVSGQIVDESERIWGPVDPGSRERGTAVSVASHGMLLAWSEVDPATHVAAIHTALLSFDAQRIGPVHKLPATRAKVHATNPAIATDGASFFVAWLERDRYSLIARDVAGVLTDAFGRAVNAPSTLGLAVPGTPALVWDGLNYRLFGSASYAVTPAGDVSILNFGDATRRAPFATPDANGWIDWSNDLPRQGCPFFYWCGGLVPPTPAAYNLDFAVLSAQWIRTGRIRETGYNASGPVVVANEDDLLIVWSNPQGLKAARLVDGESVRSFALTDVRARDTTPSLAGSLAVFDRDGDIYGAPIEGDAFGAVFPISSGEAWDSAPRVYVTGERRYLVTYVREADGPDVYLVARFVTLSP